ncbi:type I-E CRISPR-associated protein Cse2/CasB [Streptomyces sp. SAT1]|uniref:type I-E CRISPR-associated protein Cse2/CasB n=1 Tax=Streptomyces sp. SAT1 TaxID=1849967 RepID=UPI0007DD381D|nr:type I-E CRISPR-associated protein Cse2/CasB [Streptomyces sp. SAT1]ANH93160.1 type I-E CRISPR-associated protein Cse2/CasB [Streptomyces sp. SAT1]
MTALDDTPVTGEPAAIPPKRAEFLRSHDLFVTRVIAACRNAGEQQALRRALGKPVNEVPARTHAVLLKPRQTEDDGPDLPLVPYEAGDKRPFYAVAALIAARPRAQRMDTGTPRDDEEKDHSAPAADKGPGASSFRPGGTTLGESLALAVTRRDDAIKEKGAENRLHLMVRQDVEGLHRMLPSVVRLVSGAGVHVDHARLLRDLRAWPTYRDDVATRWLESYYRTLGAEREKAKAVTDR